MTTRAIVVLSGGADSTYCLFWAKHRFDEVHAITFSYGQRHSVEVVAASRVSMLAEADSYTLITIPSEMLGAVNPLTHSGAVPLDLYAPGATLPEGIAQSFVPMRNQLFLTLAANQAYCRKADVIVTGVCETDSSGYPDCRQDFIDVLEESFNLGTFTGEKGTRGNIVIHTPLMHMTKAESVHAALDEPGAYESLAWSHTAYTGGLPTDGDAASVLRARGFEEAGVPDPLVMRLYLAGKISEWPATANYSQDVRDEYSKRAFAHADAFTA